MSLKKQKNNMLIPTLIMGLLAASLLYMGYAQGGNQHLQGTKIGLTMMLQITPLLVFALIVAGMVQILIPRELLSKWIGTESGFRGIMIGAIAGGLSPGGPFVCLPIAAGLLKSGAAIGPMVAYLTGWSLWGVSRLPMEFGILGWKFTLIRISSTLIFPPLAGLVAQFFFGSVGNAPP